MKNNTWLLACVPLLATTATPLEALASLPCALLIFGICLRVKQLTTRMVCSAVLIGLYELGLKTVSFSAFTDLQAVLPLWLLLALSPVKSIKRGSLIYLILAMLALGAVRELGVNAALFTQAYRWLGLHVEQTLPITAPWLNESAVLMLLVGLGIAGLRAKGRLK